MRDRFVRVNQVGGAYVYVPTEHRNGRLYDLRVLSTSTVTAFDSPDDAWAIIREIERRENTVQRRQASHRAGCDCRECTRPPDCWGDDES